MVLPIGDGWWVDPPFTAVETPMMVAKSLWRKMPPISWDKPKGFQDSWTHCIKLISWSKLGAIEYSLYNAGSSRRELILL
jgi:hypothetical protein